MSHELYEGVSMMTAEQMRERNRGLVALACDEMRARIAELEAQAKALLDERNDAMGRVVDLVAERNEARARVTELETRLSGATDASPRTARAQSAALSATLAMQGAHEQEVCDLQDRIGLLKRDLQSRIDLLQSRVSDLTGETQYLARRVADLLGAGTYETVERALAEARREWAVVTGGAQ